ncbi:MAG: gamma-glutamyltransferase [Rhodospirillales bacterium]|nr:gamma-glutamyltransferase [Rhodospirillales bacterium]MDE2574878.1 gamma-glutamyltransferase [Rhodospirillales bacterium]
MDGKRPTIASMHGVVAAAHPLAAQAGARLLAQGGNAFDAAAATAAALNVVEPYMSGLAGMGMATCHIAAEGRIRTLDFIPPVPGHFPAGRYATREQMYRGPHASGTPGNLAGWCELVRAHGSRPLAEIFAPAIALARDGFPLIEFNTSGINQSAASLAKLPFFGEWNANYTGGHGSVRAGDVLRQPALARTYEAIVAEGPGHLYGGALGRAMIAHLQSLGGCLTMADLEAVAPRWQEPLAAGYRDLTVYSLPPPCEAFQYLLTLRILDGFDLAGLEANGVEHLDIVWRAIRLAAGVRIAHNNPAPEVLARLMAEEHVAGLHARVRDGVPVEGPTEQWLPPRPPNPQKEHTTSLSVADRAGNVVCLTQSLGALFGCGVVIPGTGVCMNNFLYWGDVDVRATNPLVPGGPLALPTAPSIATRAGRPVLALGTPGSYGICQTQPQALVQYVDFGLPLQDAIEAPRARLWDGARVQAEGRIAAATLDALRARGHAVEVAADWTMSTGGMQAIAIDAATGAMTGAADPRRDGYVATA